MDKMTREESFGRAFAILNLMSERRFERDNPSVETKYMSDFHIKPMTVYSRAHKNVMEYVVKFDGVDLALFDRINDYIGVMDASEFNDTPLEPVYLVYFSKETLNLRELIKNNQLLQEEE